MSILFSDIYAKAIRLFDDPKITTAYETNKLQFAKIMYTYLNNAIGMFNNPASIGMRLADYNEPIGTMEVFEADGKNNIFVLDEKFEIFDKAKCYYMYVEGQLQVQGKLEKRKGEKEENGEQVPYEYYVVIFPDILPEGQQYSFEQYYVGEFNDDFTKLNSHTDKGNGLILNEIKDILARLLVKAWTEEQRDVLLDIENILQDSDFKITGNDRILKAKIALVDHLDWEINQLQTKLAWNIRFMNGSTNIGRG